MRRRKRKDSGFALLLVLLMAAIIAINLYMELPRVAVESQRQKEQLLILRGEEYKRAILVFYKTNGRWPGKIEDLESFNNRRFLRKRFLDPMTGTDDWKLLHINNGVVTDSVNFKPKQPGDQSKTASTEGQYVGINPVFDTSAGAAGGAAAGPNLGRRRASDGGNAGGTLINGTADPTQVANNGNPTPPPDGSNPMANNPGGANGTVPGTPGMPGMPGFPPGVPAPPGITSPDGSNPTNTANGTVPLQPIQPGQPVQQPGQPNQPGFPGFPGLPGVPGMPVNSQTGGVSPSPYSTMPGANGAAPPFGQPGNTAPGASALNPAQNMIQQILGAPRPGGMPTTAAGGNGLVMGGGIAGVASKADQEGIMVYNDHTNYKEWEFIFDPTKWRPPANPLANTASNGTPASQIGNLQQTQIGTSVNDIVAQQNGTANTSGTSGNSTTNPNPPTNPAANPTPPVIKQQ